MKKGDSGWIRPKKNETLKGGLLVKWEERDQTFTKNGKNINRVNVKYPCCGKEGLLTQAILTRARKISKNFCLQCARKERVLEKHQNWKGGITRYRNGYKTILVRSLSGKEREIAELMKSANGYIPEHRLVMAMHIGRSLTSHESVHHVNGITDDNNIENLVLLSGSAHSRKHIEVDYELALAKRRIEELEAENKNLKELLKGKISNA
jgi:hypothetical protein